MGNVINRGISRGKHFFNASRGDHVLHGGVQPFVLRALVQKVSMLTVSTDSGSLTSESANSSIGWIPWVASVSTDSGGFAGCDVA